MMILGHKRSRSILRGLRSAKWKYSTSYRIEDRARFGTPAVPACTIQGWRSSTVPMRSGVYASTSSSSLPFISGRFRRRRPLRVRRRERAQCPASPGFHQYTWNRSFRGSRLFLPTPGDRSRRRHRHILANRGSEQRNPERQHAYLDTRPRAVARLEQLHRHRNHHRRRHRNSVLESSSNRHHHGQLDQQPLGSNRVKLQVQSALWHLCLHWCRNRMALSFRFRALFNPLTHSAFLSSRMCPLATTGCCWRPFRSFRPPPSGPVAVPSTAVATRLALHLHSASILKPRRLISAWQAWPPLPPQAGSPSSPITSEFPLLSLVHSQGRPR